MSSPFLTVPVALWELILKIFISDGHIDDNFLEEPQISSFPYWRFNHLGHGDTLTD